MTGLEKSIAVKKLVSEASMTEIAKGDYVVMNNKYRVSEQNKGKVFKVTTEPTEVCGTLSVWLEGYRGCYAVDGLDLVRKGE